MLLPCSAFWRNEARSLTAARLRVRHRETLGRSARSGSARGFGPSLLLLLLIVLPLLSPTNASAACIVHCQEPAFWESYRWYIVGIAAACVIEALLIALLLLVQRR